MNNSPSTWQLKCDAKTFDKVRADEKFSYIVALARAVNAVNYVHSILEFEREIETPAAIRNRINSYLFASSILYEALMLIRKMTRTFKTDNKFNNGLRQLLREKMAIAFERQNLNPLRNGAVFHFLPDRFSDAINKTRVKECLFSSGHGDKKKDTTYPFADIIAAEILVGVAVNQCPPMVSIGLRQITRAPAW